MSVAELWWFLIVGYVATVAIELPILIFGLSERTNVAERFKLGFILTGFTYPIVVLVLPVLISIPFGQLPYIVVAETFAPLAEIVCFRMLVKQKLFVGFDRDAFVILAANLCSFLIGWVFLSDLILKTIQSF